MSTTSLDFDAFDWSDGAVRAPSRLTSRPDDVIPLGEATRAWFAISLQTFGGPAGQIAVMQHKLVDEMIKSKV